MRGEARILLEALHVGEISRWRDERLWFSDFFAHAVKSVSLASDLRTEFELDDQPSGHGWTSDGALLVVAMKSMKVLKRGADGKTSVHADISSLAAHLANDMVVDAASGAYVGNFGFDLEHELMTRGPQGVIRDHPTAKLARVSPSREVSLAYPDMHFPNGSVITPDALTLIVRETLAGPHRLRHPYPWHARRSPPLVIRL